MCTCSTQRSRDMYKIIICGRRQVLNGQESCVSEVKHPQSEIEILCKLSLRWERRNVRWRKWTDTFIWLPRAIWEGFSPPSLSPLSPSHSLSHLEIYNLQMSVCSLHFLPLHIIALQKKMEKGGSC